MSIWQTKQWGKMLLESGQAKSIFEIPHPNNLLTGEGIKSIFVEKRKIGIGEYGLFILGVKENLINKNLLKNLIKLCKKEKVLFIQIETINYKVPPSQPSPQGEEGVKEGYYKKFITPYTAVIDLNQTEEEILKKMKPKGRYNIRLAEKKAVEVKEVTKSKENIEKFYNLMIETTSRDNFSGNSLNYYISFLNNIKCSKLLLAYKDEKIISGGIFVFDKKVSIYYYGASTSNPKYRNLMAPYLLQWKAIQIAKESGSQIYDFLGVSSPGDKNSKLSGVTNFKKKFTSNIIKVSSSYIWINRKYKYYFLIIIKKIRGIILKR